MTVGRSDDFTFVPAGGRDLAENEQSQQRARILTATVAVAAERGLAAASPASVTARAHVSRRTFSAHFDSVDDVLISVIDDALDHVSALVRRACGTRKPWRARLREALVKVLAFLDRRPELARVLLVETLAGGPALLRHRQEALDSFCALVAARIAADSATRSPLAAEAGLASVMGVVYARLLDPSHSPLVELVGPLMGVLTAAAWTGPEIEIEMRRGAELAHKFRESPLHPPEEAGPLPDNGALPKLLRDPRSFRARQCLLYTVAHPGSSNRAIGDGIGVAHRGQLCALLNGLLREGLVSKDPGRPGHPNSWSATRHGHRIALLLRDAQRPPASARGVHTSSGEMPSMTS